MPLVHTRNFRVRHYECDAYGHLNNANYLRYMQEAAFDASAAAGYGMLRYEADRAPVAGARYGDRVPAAAVLQR